MRIRIPVSVLAVLAIGLGLAAGIWLGYGMGRPLEVREPAASPVSAPVATAARFGKVAATVRMTPQQYLPGTVNVRRGEAVRFENAGDAGQWPESDTGPGADGIVVAGSSWDTRFSRPGTFIYRDRVYPHVGVTVIVE